MTSIRTTADIYQSMGIIPKLHRVLTPVGDVITPDFYLTARPAKWDAYIDAQDCGDDDV
jgi:hypothetical protein